MIEVDENEDGTFTISWDETSPTESFLNTWTEKDFQDAIYNYCQQVLGATDHDLSSEVQESN